MTSAREQGGGILKFLATIDRRIVYFVLFVLVVGPLISPIGMPISVAPDTVQYHNAIAQLGPDDVVLLHLGTEFSGWNELSAGAMASAKMVVEREAKLVIIVGHPEATGIPPLIYEGLKGVMEAKGYKYREDTLNLGYMFPNEPAVAAAAADFHGLVRTDYLGNSIEGTFLNKVKTAADWALIIDINTGIWNQALINHWRLPFGTKIVAHIIGVMVSGAKANVDAGLYEGSLGSLRGGAELEYMIKAPGPGLQAMDAFTLAHYSLLIFIVLGNIGYFGYTRPARVKERTAVK